MELVKVDSSLLEADDADPAALFKDIDGFLVPGGFGQRGIGGMVASVGWARKNGVPLFGICLGMQVMVIEWARGVLGWADADSTEFERQTPHPVVSLLEEQENVTSYGGTMRLGKSESLLKDGTRIRGSYAADSDLGAAPPPLRGVERPAARDRGGRPCRIRPDAGREPR